MPNGIFVDKTIRDKILLSVPKVFKQHEMEDQGSVSIVESTNTE